MKLINTTRYSIFTVTYMLLPMVVINTPATEKLHTDSLQHIGA